MVGALEEGTAAGADAGGGGYEGADDAKVGAVVKAEGS